MEDEFLILMVKDSETGFLDRELATYKMNEHIGLVANIYATENAEGKLVVHAHLTTDRDVLDWEFNAVYDYYDDEAFGESILSVKEVGDCNNPTWEVVFEYIDEESIMEKIIGQILLIHYKELQDVYETIQNLESDYE